MLHQGESRFWRHYLSATVSLLQQEILAFNLTSITLSDVRSQLVCVGWLHMPALEIEETLYIISSSSNKGFK